MNKFVHKRFGTWWAVYAALWVAFIVSMGGMFDPLWMLNGVISAFIVATVCSIARTEGYVDGLNYTQNALRRAFYGEEEAR